MATGGTSVVAGLTRAERRSLRELVITATAAAGRPERRSRLGDLVAAAPVHALPAVARHHRVAGSVRRGLEHVDGVPRDVRDELEAAVAAATWAHLRHVGALAEVASSLDGAGVRWTVMKGPVLAAHHYPDVGDRSYSDLDLLVDRRDFPGASELLEQLGYAHRTHNWGLAEQMLAGQVGLERGPVRIDLHWHLHYAPEERRPYALRPDAMVARARRVDVSGVSVPTLDPVDSLMTVAFHAARSDGHALVWYKDVERVLAVDGPDLGELVHRCHEARCAPAVGLVLELASELLAADVPERVIAELVPRSVRGAHRAVRRRSPPIRLHDRSTLTRVVTRSVGPSARATVAALPPRYARRLRRRLFPPPVNETDDPGEKAAYFRAVVATEEP